MPRSALDEYIAQKFRSVGVRLHHAENLHNFSVYCEQRALLARAELRQLSDDFTKFYSDEEDEQRGALSRVFGNLRDFGVIMACGSRTIPNVYGPIQLIFRSDCFDHMTDIVITKVSIASLHDRWRGEAAATPQTINHIASGRREDGFVSPGWRNGEVSCAESRLSFELLAEVVVEPLVIAGQRLLTTVRTALHMAGYGRVPVSERRYKVEANLGAIAAGARYCQGLPEGLAEDSDAFAEVAELREFSDRSADLKRRLGLWARYLYFGTVVEVRERDRRFEEMMDAVDAADTRESCQLCDPGEDRGPAMVTFGAVFIDGVRSALYEEGTCDWCNGTTVRCLNCGESTPIWPRPGTHEVECAGGCGIEFAATYEETRDGAVTSVEVVGAITDASLDDELTSIIQAQYEDDFIQAVHEGEYPVCDVELDQLVVVADRASGTATAEWGFGASHPSVDGLGFGGLVKASITFDPSAATRSALKDSVSAESIDADFDMGDDDDYE